MKYRPSYFNIAFDCDGNRYVYNSRSSALVQLDEGYCSHATHDELDELFDSGILVGKNEDEISGLMGDVSATIARSSCDLACTLVLTKACNFSCSYCYQDRSKDRFSAADVETFLQCVEDYLAVGGKKLRVHYFGGEPLLEWETLKRIDTGIKSLVHQYGARYESEISTNGRLLDVNKARAVGFARMRLTFDGDAYWHHRIKKPVGFSYQDQLELIEDVLAATESNIIVRLNICKENAQSFLRVQEDIFLLRNYRSQMLRFEYARMRLPDNTHGFTELSPEEYAETVWQLTKHARKGGINTPFPQPAAMPCPFSVGCSVCVGPGMRRQFCSEVDASPVEGKGLTRTLDPFVMRRECRECKVAPLCLGGCPLLSGEAMCIPERFLIEEMLRDYIRHPDEWRVERGRQ